jgi:Domain of unknown function (DUF4190)
MNPINDPVTAVPNPAPVSNNEPAKTSGLAVASLILGLLGFLILPAVGGLVCGIVALGKIRQSNGRLQGRGIALSGTVVSSIMLALIPVMAILAALLLPALASAKSKAQTIMSMNNVRQLGLAARMYATDSKDRFPTPAQWCDLLQPYIGGNDRVFLRPVDQQRGGRSSYGYNTRLSSSKASEVHPNTVVVFELQEADWNVSGGPELLRRPRNSHDPVIVGFADGHSEAVTQSRTGSLRWDP